MINRRQLLKGTVGLFAQGSALSLSSDLAHGQTPSSVFQGRPRARISRLALWFWETGLGEHLQVTEILSADHPDEAKPRRGVCLEARWVTQQSSRSTAVAEFDAFAVAFERLNAQTVTEKLLVKFAHTMGISPKLAWVRISIFENAVSAFLTSEGQFQTRDTLVRSVRVGKSISIAAPAMSQPATVQAGIRTKQSSGAIAEWLRARYLSSAPGCVFTLEEMDDEFVDFTVQAMQSQVIKDQRYWETIEASLLIWNKQEQFRIRLCLDGRFAAGGLLSITPPIDDAFYDMEPKYNKHLTLYANVLGNELRDHLLQDPL